MNQQRFQREVQRRNGRPWRIIIRPQRTAANIEAEPLIENLIYEMRRAIYQTVHSYNGWSRRRILEEIRGFIIAENLLNGENRFYQTSRLISANDLDRNIFESVLEDIQESNLDIWIYDISWHFIISPRSLIGGNGNPKKPDWISNDYASTWETQVSGDIELNCAAYSLAHGMFVGKKLKTPIINKALGLMEDFDWYKDVTPAQIEQFVKVYKDYRVSIVMKRLTSGTITYQGEDFR
jgi:hypothetical protein